jgi:xylulokinase
VREQFTAGPLDAVTDVVDAQGTMLVDVATSTWSPLTLGLCGITADLLPRIVEPLHRAGEIDPGAAQAVGLPHTVNIVTGSTDTATELLAAGITESGTTAVKLATAGNVARVTETLPEPSRDIVYSYLFPGTYYLNTATSSAAASMRWVSRILGAAGHLDYADLDELSESTRPGAEGLVFTPYLNGERSPHWDPDLRGSLVGLTDRTQPRHIARAVMEGVAFSLKDAADVVGVSLTGTLVLIGGGARSRVWPQIIADVLGAAVVCAPECDSSAGAALLAARQHGHPIALRSATVQTRVDPSRSAAEVYARLFPVYRAVAAATREPAHALKDISTS